MNIKSKKKLSDYMIGLMIITTIVVLFWFICDIVSSTFGLTVFKQSTFEFIAALLGASLAIVVCAAFLSVSLNISIMADLKITENEKSISKLKTNIKRYFQVLIISIIVFVGFLFLGDYLSKMKEKKNIIYLGNDIVSRYSVTLNKISLSFDNKKIKSIPSKLAFLKQQNTKFDKVSLISSEVIDNQIVFLTINANDDSQYLNWESYKENIYKSDENEIEYIKDVFINNKMNTELKVFKGNNYILYIPLMMNNRKFIIILEKEARYGKFGS